MNDVLHQTNGQRRRMLMSAFLVTTILLGALPTITAAGAAPAPSIADNPAAIAAPSALLMDQASGRILWSKNIDQVVRPASLTKLMTLMLVFEALDSGKVKLSDLVPVSEQAWKTGGSRMFLRVGTKPTLEDIIKGITVASGNDACVAAAELISGTVENFVAQMNTKAQELGLANTRFVDPHGISNDNQTSARDIATLARLYVESHPKALAYHSMKSFTFVPAGGKPITQQNRNRLLGVYAGADGLKTGHTEAAGYNLVATAEREGTRFVAVILGVKARTEPQGEQLRAEQAAKLLDYGFATFQTQTVVAQGEQLGEIRVYKGKQNAVKVGPGSDVKYTVEKSAGANVSKKTTLEQRLVAPVKKGQTVGSLQVLVNDQVVQTVPIVALEEMPAGGFFKRVLDSLKLLFQRSVRVE